MERMELLLLLLLRPSSDEVFDVFTFHFYYLKLTHSLALLADHIASIGIRERPR